MLEHFVPCRKAVLSMRLDSAAYEDESGSEDEDDNADKIGVTTSRSKMIKYNKRAAYFTDPAKIKLRLNTNLCHQKQLINGNRVTCVYCCCKKHDEMTTNHSRLGHKTSFVCFTCQVPLCYVVRFGEDTCSKLFHEKKEANDPCIDSAEVTVRRSHTIRGPPPSRKRRADEQPNTRSKSAPIYSPRKTRPKKDKGSRRLSFS